MTNGEICEAVGPGVPAGRLWFSDHSADRHTCQPNATAGAGTDVTACYPNATAGAGTDVAACYPNAYTPCGDVVG